MSDKIPAAIAKAIDDVDQSEQIAAIEEKHSDLVQSLEGHHAEIQRQGAVIEEMRAGINHLMQSLAHILPPLPAPPPVHHLTPEPPPEDEANG